MKVLISFIFFLLYQCLYIIFFILIKNLTLVTFLMTNTSSSMSEVSLFKWIFSFAQLFSTLVIQASHRLAEFSKHVA